ncbi:hypothetical protein PR048_016629 [Dryococelus australis]|uniref:Uncharacterized protein n=1 Tax=Dryococelus australis TaxID=614101 RepID=A0ABQ9H790_9NEOP|nr:hypothetical protein PR048_016629 [Dryococelus australis]
MSVGMRGKWNTAMCDGSMAQGGGGGGWHVCHVKSKTHLGDRSSQSTHLEGAVSKELTCSSSLWQLTSSGTPLSGDHNTVYGCSILGLIWSGAGMKGRGIRELHEKTLRPSGTIPTCENPVTRIEPGSAWWEASRFRRLLTSWSSEPTGVIEENLEQHRSEGVEKTGDARDDPSVTRPGIEPGSPWWEASVLIAQPPWPLIEKDGKQYFYKALACFPPSSVCLTESQRQQGSDSRHAGCFLQVVTAKWPRTSEGPSTPPALSFGNDEREKSIVRGFAGPTGGLSELHRDVQGVLTSGLCVLCGLVRETSSARREIPSGWYKGPSTPPALSFGNDEREKSIVRGFAGPTGGLSELHRDVQGVLTSGLCVLCGLVRETSSARREIPSAWYKGPHKGPSTPPALSFGND